MPGNLTEAAKELRRGMTDAERVLWQRLRANSSMVSSSGVRNGSAALLWISSVSKKGWLKDAEKRSLEHNFSVQQVV